MIWTNFGFTFTYKRYRSISINSFKSHSYLNSWNSLKVRIDERMKISTSSYQLQGKLSTLMTYLWAFGWGIRLNEEIVSTPKWYSIYDKIRRGIKWKWGPQKVKMRGEEVRAFRGSPKLEFNIIGWGVVQ